MSPPGPGAPGGAAPARRVLLDECVPRRFGRALPQFAVVHVRDAGWTGRRNGVLLRLMPEAGSRCS